MFRQGEQIGSYCLLNKLGKGGFGEVWLAEKRSMFLTKKVAVKLPLDEQVDFEMVRREASLWEQASGHPNVLPIIDADIYDGQVVIVSEYADGGSLADKLRTRGSLPVPEAVATTIGILSGLDYLHRKQIIHRDIKPQNILLQDGTPRLADFGISRAMSSTSQSMTIGGTDAYMAPEAFDGKRSAQTDIWSVGVVLYQLLTGKLPYPQNHPLERMFAIMQKEFEPLPETIPEDLRRIVQKALTKLPEYRYRSAREMLDDLSGVSQNASRPFDAEKALPPPEETVTKTPSVQPTVDWQEAARQKELQFRNENERNLEKLNQREKGKTVNRDERYTIGAVVLSGVGVLFLLFAIWAFLPSNRGSNVITNANNSHTGVGNSNSANLSANFPANRPGPPTPSPSTKSPADEYLERAARCKGNDYDCQIENYSKVIELDPNNYKAYTNRGDAYTARGKYAQALKDLNQAIQLRPDAAEAYHNRGVLSAVKANYDAAIRDYDKAIELNPNVAEYYISRGISYQQKNNLIQAESDFRKAVALAPNNSWAKIKLDEVLKKRNSR